MGWQPRWSRWSVVVALVIASLPLTVGVGSADVERRPKPPPVPTVEWAPCGPDYPGAECAIAVVPLDYDDPAGATTEIALARVPAADQANRIGSVFVNPGGPGGPGVGFVLSGFGDFLAANLGGRFDVVGFDPRGVGLSDPLHCFESEEELIAFLDSQPIFPYERGQYRPFFDAYTSLSGECRDDGQVIVDHMNTADVARDLDLLRQAVGDEKLSYLGFSYGSYIGTTYANLFPRNVRALVIDGVLNPALWSSGWQIRSDRVATEEVFDEFLRLCDEAADSCPFYAPGGSEARWDALRQAVRDAPIVLPDGFVYTYDFLIADSAGAMYAPEVWVDFAAFLDFLADVTAGDVAAATQAAALRASLVERLTPPKAEADYPNGFDAYFGNHCADAEYPSRFATWRTVDRYAAAGSEWGPYWWWFNTPCATWPVNEDRYAGPWTTRTSAPVLVVGNYFDPATDYRGAQAANRFLRGSALLSYAGWGHTAYGRSECTTEYVNAYLVDGAVPPAGTVCPANPNPFLELATADQRSAAPAPLVGLPGASPIREFAGR